MAAPILVFGYGNPSRGDDALGPLLIDSLQRSFAVEPGIDFLTDFQLQIEHALDLADRELVLFADAHVSCARPFQFERLVGTRDDSYTTHAMSPAAVLQVYQRLHAAEPPPTFLLSIRGYRFGLGDHLSTSATHNLSSAVRFCRELLGNPRLVDWRLRTSGPEPQRATPEVFG